MLNPIWLNTFKTLIDVGHFTRTAEKLHMTQPGVSQHIKKLEEACGHALIKREKKSFDLTEQGRLMYQYTLEQKRNELQLLEQLSFDDPYAGNCYISCSGAMAMRIYPTLIALQTKHPQLVIHIEVAPHNKIIEAIKNGTADIGIVTQKPAQGAYQWQQIGQEALCLVIPNSTKNTQVTPELLQKLGLIRHPDAEHYLSIYFAHSQDEALAGIAIDSLPSVGYINQLSQILVPITQGIGFTVLPFGAVEAHVEQQQVRLHQPKTSINETVYSLQKYHRQLPTRYKTVLQSIRVLMQN